jgi:hypothetical protein
VKLIYRIFSFLRPKDAAYFIDKFSAIDESLWITNSFQDDFGRACALGHCNDGEGEMLRQLFTKHGYPLISINDGDDREFRQANPKARVLAALNSILTGKKRTASFYYR